MLSQKLPDNPIKINAFEFLYEYFYRRNFYDAVHTLEERYHSTDFEIQLPFFTFFYIIQNKNDVKRILTANTTSGFQNHNFDLAHGHPLNINATQAFTSTGKNPIWRNIHHALAQSVGTQQFVKSLVQKHIKKMFLKTHFELDIAFEDCMLDFWCEYLFGKNVSSSDFKKTRQKLLGALRFSFYDNSLKNIPYIGNLTSRLYRYVKQNEFNEIDRELQHYIDQASVDSLIYHFKQNLSTSREFPHDKIKNATLDNTFIFMLVFDFIHNALYETLVSIVKSNANTKSEKEKCYEEGLKRAFLFPFRVRTPYQELPLTATTIPHNTPTYINLVKAGLYHSFGPRMCLGMQVSKWIREETLNALQNIQFNLVKTAYPSEREILSHNLDIPISKERYRVEWQYPRNYLQNILPHHEFKDVKTFYDILKIYENPSLSSYICESFISKIKKRGIDPAKLAIVSPELRGIPLAAIVSDALKIPLIIIRKKDKIPGNVLRESYKTAYSTDDVEISESSDLKDKEVIFIDDGISSGGTALASCHLIKKLGGNIQLILAIINHTSSKKPAELQEYPIETLFDFTPPYAKNNLLLFKPKKESGDKETLRSYANCI